MSSEGPNSGATFANDATVGTDAWTSPGSASASDDNQASVILSEGAATEYLRATNFGFSIPAGSLIDGIVVGVERGDSTERANDFSIRLYHGSFVGDNKATGTPWPTAEAYANYGSSSDDWNAGLSAADINDSTFGVGVSATSPIGIAFPVVDHIRITVHYTESQTELYGIAAETDAALALSAEKLETYGVASEIDAALALVHEKLAGYGVAEETDEALAVVRKYLYGVATETDTALAFAAELAKLAEYGTAEEVDEGLAFITFKVRGGVYFPMGVAHSPFMLKPANRRRNRRPE